MIHDARGKEVNENPIDNCSEDQSNRQSSTAQTFERIAVIRNKRGLHARAAAKFVTEAGKFDASITVRRGDMNVSGNSIMGLMMLAAGPSCDIEIITSGTDALNALKALCDLVEAKFGED